MQRYYAVPLSVQKSYAYPVARVRALESRLVDRQRIDRLLDAPTLDEALRVLSETDYAAPAGGGAGGGGGGAVSPTQYDRALEAELERVLALVAAIVPQPQLAWIFRVDRDATLIKALLRERFFGGAGRAGEAARGWSERAPEDLRAAITSGDAKRLQWPRSAMVAEGIAGYEAGRPVWEVEARLDGLTFTAKARWAQELGDPFIAGVVRAAADAANIVTFLRCAVAGYSAAVFSRLVLDEGSVKTAGLIAAYGQAQPEEALIQALSGTPYQDLLAAGLKGRSGSDAARAARSLLDRYLHDQVGMARMIPAGPAPVFAYVYARLREARFIRAVFEGRLARLPAEVVRERLAEL